MDAKLSMLLECTVEFIHPPNRSWVTIRLLSGDVDTGMNLQCLETLEVYSLANLGLLGWKGMAAGYREIFLQPLGVAGEYEYANAGGFVVRR